MKTVVFVVIESIITISNQLLLLHYMRANVCACFKWPIYRSLVRLSQTKTKQEGNADLLIFEHK